MQIRTVKYYPYNYPKFMATIFFAMDAFYVYTKHFKQPKERLYNPHLLTFAVSKY